MTHVFQPLDLTVNKFAKDFVKGMFSLVHGFQDKYL